MRRTYAGACVYEALEASSLGVAGETLTITGELGGLQVRHRLTAPAARTVLEERITLQHSSSTAIVLSELTLGMRRPVANAIGQVLPDLAGDHLVAVTLRHRATDPAGVDQDFSVDELLRRGGEELARDGFALRRRALRIRAFAEPIFRRQVMAERRARLVHLQVQSRRVGVRRIDA